MIVNYISMANRIEKRKENGKKAKQMIYTRHSNHHFKSQTGINVLSIQSDIQNCANTNFILKTICIEYVNIKSSTQLDAITTHQTGPTTLCIMCRLSHPNDDQFWYEFHNENTFVHFDNDSSHFGVYNQVPYTIRASADRCSDILWHIRNHINTHTHTAKNVRRYIFSIQQNFHFKGVFFRLELPLNNYKNRPVESPTLALSQQSEHHLH